MTRKDTILIAVVINAGLLAVLFTTAIIYDTDSGSEQMEFVYPLVDNKTVPNDPSSDLIAAVSTGDEVDNVLKYYTPQASQSIAVQARSEIYLPPSMQVQSNGGVAEEAKSSSGKKFTENSSREQYVEVVVKRGDVLEKIARANKTSVAAIKQANQIDGERLSIGQVLRIPVKQPSSTSVSTPIAMQVEPVKIESKQEIKKEAKEVEPVNKTTEPMYYVIKSGDNPWKIAKQHGVKYDEILRLNHLDEDKARNLKIGDRIRVQ